MVSYSGEKLTKIKTNWYNLGTDTFNEWFCSIENSILKSLVLQCIEKRVDTNPLKLEETKNPEDICGGTLYTGNFCYRILNITSCSALYSLTYILTNTTNDPLNVIVPALKPDPTCSNYLLSRQQVKFYYE